MSLPIELHYWPTPNGWKISIALEEMGLPYELKPVNIGRGEQFDAAFQAISPNGRMPAIDRLVGLFARTEKPIDFDALDGQPVDIDFVLIAPEGAGADHLKALARVARVLRNQSVLEQVRKVRDPSAIYAILAESAAQAA